MKSIIANSRVPEESRGVDFLTLLKSGQGAQFGFSKETAAIFLKQQQELREPFDANKAAFTQQNPVLPEPCTTRTL